MPRKNETRAEVKQLSSGYWAVFIDGTFMDASSPSKEAAQAKLDQFLLHKKAETVSPSKR